MNPKYMPLLDYIQSSIPVSSDIQNVTSLAVGMAAGYAAPLPSAPVENPMEYFNQTASTLVRTLINQANEELIVDFDEAVNHALSFWRMRYHQLYMLLNSEVGSPYGFFDTIAGAHLFVSPETHQIANQYKAEIFRIKNCLVPIFEQLAV